jgi:hypothetical protein
VGHGRAEERRLADNALYFAATRMASEGTLGDAQRKAVQRYIQRHAVESGESLPRIFPGGNPGEPSKNVDAHHRRLIATDQAYSLIKNDCIVDPDLKLLDIEPRAQTVLSKGFESELRFYQGPPNQGKLYASILPGFLNDGFRTTLKERDEAAAASRQAVVSTVTTAASVISVVTRGPSSNTDRRTDASPSRTFPQSLTTSASSDPKTAGREMQR